MEKINLGKDGPLISRIGLGCMRMSGAFGRPGRPDEGEGIATIRAALDEGINFLNTGDFYASGHNELLVREGIKGRRDDAFISVKFGAMLSAGKFLGFDMRPAAIKNFCEYSLVRLGVDTIDLYQPCRIDPSIPMEDIVGSISELIAVGKVKYLGMSELTAEELRKAHSIHPVTALEKKYSIFDRELEKELLPTARELGIGIVAYGNTADGLLSGTVDIPTDPNDYRRHNPAFHEANLATTLAKVERLKAMAQHKNCTLPQLAIAWVMAKGADIMPLVGMSKPSRLPENLEATEITLSSEEIRLIED